MSIEIDEEYGLLCPCGWDCVETQVRRRRGRPDQWGKALQPSLQGDGGGEEGTDWDSTVECGGKERRSAENSKACAPGPSVG